MVVLDTWIPSDCYRLLVYLSVTLVTSTSSYFFSSSDSVCTEWNKIPKNRWPPSLVLRILRENFYLLSITFPSFYIQIWIVFVCFSVYETIHPSSCVGYCWRSSSGKRSLRYEPGNRFPVFIQLSGERQGLNGILETMKFGNTILLVKVKNY